MKSIRENWRAPVATPAGGCKTRSGFQENCYRSHKPGKEPSLVFCVSTILPETLLVDIIRSSSMHAFAKASARDGRGPLIQIDSF